MSVGVATDIISLRVPSTDSGETLATAASRFLLQRSGHPLSLPGLFSFSQTRRWGWIFGPHFDGTSFFSHIPRRLDGLVSSELNDQQQQQQQQPAS